MRLAPLAFFLLAALGLAASPARAADEPARAIHLLDYIAADYPEAVQDGEVINRLEFEEQLEFVATVGDLVAARGVGPLAQPLAELRQSVESRASAEEVARCARTLAAGIRSRFGVRALPDAPPSLERGKSLYAEACAACHGAEGRGDGPAGAGLDPAPTDFTDRQRAFALSPFTLYSTITYGIKGTGMAPFADRFDRAERYDLAFYVGSLAFSTAERQRGRTLAESEPERLAAAVPDLATLAEQPAETLMAGADPDGLALVAFARSEPAALQSGDLPLRAAQRELRESWRRYRAGDREGALEHAVGAYLDGFERIEPALDSVDRDLRVAIETDFMRYRSAIRSGTPPETLEPLYAGLEERLAAAERRLAEEGLAPAAAFGGAFAIVAREGAEAALILAAIAGVLIRTGRRSAMRFFHAGWVAAAVGGAATWIAARTLVEVSGAPREVIEGITSLLAMGVLFYVSYWLLARLEASRWQGFVDSRLKRSLSSGSLLGLASITFLAVYRELFETILFLEALLAQAGPGGWRAVALGIVSAAAALTVVAGAIYRFGLRVPLRSFFALSSVLLYLLAFTLAGHGVAALQEAGWVAATPVSSAGFGFLSWFGVYPTLEGLALQGFLVAAALAAIPWSLRRPAAALLLLGLGAGLGTPACAPKVVRETIVQNDRLTVLLRETVPREGDPVPEAFAHPVVIAPSRVAAILSHVDVRPKGAGANEREAAVPTDLLYPIADGISKALAQAGPRQEVVVMARRSERRLGLFTREYLTSLVTVARGERLELHFFHVDWPIPGDPQAELREPRVGQAHSSFRVIPSEAIEALGPFGAAAVWRDPRFRHASSLSRGPGGKVRRRTILMDSPSEESP